MNADFDLLTVQPDLNLSSNGFYDAQALRNNPSFADPFKVGFVWLGTVGSTPGAQPVTVYNADLSTQSQSQTTNIPEPSALALVLAAWLAAPATSRPARGRSHKPRSAQRLYPS